MTLKRKRRARVLKKPKKSKKPKKKRRRRTMKSVGFLSENAIRSTRTTMAVLSIQMLIYLMLGTTPSFTLATTKQNSVILKVSRGMVDQLVMCSRKCNHKL